MVNKEKKLTSVHVNISDHNKFKHLCVEDKMTFQALVNAVLKKYVSDDNFRRLIKQ